MQIRVLGPIELWSSGAALAIGGPKQRAVLALLLARAGTLLPVDDIVAELWDDRPPPSAGANARMYANNLRRLLAGRADAAVLSRVGDGYRLDLNGAETDLSEFRRWVTDARQRSTAGDPATAVSRFDAALDLWRGPPVSDVPAGRLLSRWRVTVTEERWSAVEDRADALLRLGGHERVSADMRDLLTAEPLRERAHALLARARYQAGDVAGALAVLDDARRVLAEELGVEPGDELRELHKAVLNRDPGVARSARPAVPASRSAPVPRQLPAGVAGFTGRREFLRRLDAHLPDGRSAAAPATVLITAIDGTAGVGKTCLAVHWARRVAGRFPDGQLYVNLRGFDAAPPMAPEDALRRFLDALGVPARQVPQDVEAQAALYRSLLADRRMLVVLDNARDAEQVRPLLPGSTGCLALITSRSRLTPLVVTSGADTMTLDVLSEREAHDLLARRLGAERVAAEPDAVDSIIAACGRLPLALAVVAARAAQGGVPLGGLAAELRPAGGRSLDALDGGDLATRVRAVFSWSYAALDAPAARLFRLLGLHPGPDLAVDAAASLAGLPAAETARLLGELVGASLLGEPVPGRFALHDLLRTYAAELATTVDSEAERHDALRRLLDHYTHTAHAAARLLYPQHEPMPLPLDPAAPGTTPTDLPDQAAAAAWFADQHSATVRALRAASDPEFDGRVWRLVWSLDDYAQTRKKFEDVAALWELAAAAADRMGDVTAQAYASRLLGLTYVRLGRPDQAEPMLLRAAELYARSGDEVGQADSHRALTINYDAEGRMHDALAHAHRSLALYRAAGNRRGEAIALNSLGWLHTTSGEPARALVHSEQAVSVLEELDDRNALANALDSLGLAHSRLGNHGESVGCYRRALALSRERGDRHDEAVILDNLGDALLEGGEPAAAAGAWREALELYEEFGHRNAEAVRAKLREISPGTPPG